MGLMVVVHFTVTNANVASARFASRIVVMMHTLARQVALLNTFQKKKMGPTFSQSLFGKNTCSLNMRFLLRNTQNPLPTVNYERRCSRRSSLCSRALRAVMLLSTDHLVRVDNASSTSKSYWCYQSLDSACARRRVRSAIFMFSESIFPISSDRKLQSSAHGDHAVNRCSNSICNNRRFNRLLQHLQIIDSISSTQFDKAFI